MLEMYTDAHEQAFQSGNKEIQRYDEKFRPLVEGYRDSAINWDTKQRRQFNQDRANISSRQGLRNIMKSAGADASNIIKGGTMAGNVMAGATVQGDQVTGWQRLKKLTNMAQHARNQKGTVEQGMMNYGNMQSEMNRSQAAIKQYLDEARSSVAGSVLGTAAGYYGASGGWWSGSKKVGGADVTTLTDGAGGGVSPGLKGTNSYQNMINGTDQMYS